MFLPYTNFYDRTTLFYRSDNRDSTLEKQSPYKDFTFGIFHNSTQQLYLCYRISFGTTIKYLKLIRIEMCELSYQIFLRGHTK